MTCYTIPPHNLCKFQLHENEIRNSEDVRDILIPPQFTNTFSELFIAGASSHLIQINFQVSVLSMFAPWCKFKVFDYPPPHCPLLPRFPCRFPCHFPSPANFPHHSPFRCRYRRVWSFSPLSPCAFRYHPRFALSYLWKWSIIKFCPQCASLSRTFGSDVSKRVWNPKRVPHVMY